MKLYPLGEFSNEEYKFENVGVITVYIYDSKALMSLDCKVMQLTKYNLIAGGTV